MTLCILFTVLGTASLMLYVSEKLRAFTPRAVLRKTLVSAFFVLTAIAATYATAAKGSFGFFITAGLVFGLFGDVWLDLKFVYPDDDEVWSRAGFKSFAIGHIFFMLGMVLNFADLSKPAYIIVPLLLGVVCGFGAVLAGPIMKLAYGKFRAISLIYGGFLFGMMLMAGSLALQHGWESTTLNMMFAGGILFAVSDLVLSGTYFGEGHDGPVDIIANYITYYGAQFIIALSILFI